MVKNILVVGASGLVGSNILELLEDGDSKITLLTRRKLEDKAYLKQIISEFNNIAKPDEMDSIDEVYIAIGKKLSLFELIYIKKEDRKDFEMVDFDYIKNVALFAKHCGAKSVALVSAIGANNKSSNIYLSVKGKIEKEIMSLGFNKVVIAQPSHLLGKRPDEQTNYLISLFEKITNILGNLMIGPLKKYRNISAAQVANSLVSKMSSDDDGVYVLDFENFKNQ